MGIYIFEDIIPARIKKDDWTAVYNESLKLLDNFPFLDQMKMTTEHGSEYICASRSRERNDVFNGYTGWRSMGDMYTGKNTEYFALISDLDYYKRKCSDNGADVLTCEIPDTAYPELKITDHNDIGTIFCNKTQGEKSHLYLLAIACLIADRFPDAAHVYGDINIGQCRAAVEWANQFLDRPISLPVQCNAEQLLARLMNLEGVEPLMADGRLLELFFSLTLENKNNELGDAIRQCVPDATIKAYFSNQFKDAEDRDRAYLNKEVKEYLSLGFGLDWLAEFLVVNPEGCRLTPAEFLDMLFGMQLHVEDKETYDMTVGDMDNDSPDNVSMQFARVFGRMGGAYNRNVNAYMPPDEIRETCRKVFGDKCSVDEEIQAALDRDREKREKMEKPDDQVQDKFYGGGNSEFMQMVNDRIEKDKQNEAYDIKEMEDAVYYKPGNTFTPEIEEALSACGVKIHSFHTLFKKFRKMTIEKREQRLIEMDRYLLIPDYTWDRMLTNIMDDAYIRRYYAFLSVDVSNQEMLDFINMFMMNPDLLDYVWEITDRKESIDEK